MPYSSGPLHETGSYDSWSLELEAQRRLVANGQPVTGATLENEITRIQVKEAAARTHQKDANRDAAIQQLRQEVDRLNSVIAAILRKQ
jgi:hypothetical protein